MAIRTLDRLLLIPALIVLGSVTLAGCSLLPGGGNPAPTSSSDKSDDADSDDAGSDDDEGVEAGAALDCPDDFSAAGIMGFGGEGFQEITVAEFSAPIGDAFLESGCLYRFKNPAGDVESSTDLAYIAGDEATIVEIGAKLEDEGYTKLGEGVYSTEAGGTAFVLGGSEQLSADQAAALEEQFGGPVIMVMSSVSAP